MSKENSKLEEWLRGFGLPRMANPDHPTGFQYFDMWRCHTIYEDYEAGEEAAGHFAFLPDGLPTWSQFLTRWEMDVVPMLPDWTQRIDIRVEAASKGEIVSAYQGNIYKLDVTMAGLLRNSTNSLRMTTQDSLVEFRERLKESRDQWARDGAPELALSEIGIIKNMEVPAIGPFDAEGLDWRRSNALPEDDTRVQCSILARPASLMIGHAIGENTYPPMLVSPAALCLWAETQMRPDGGLDWRWCSTIYSTQSLTFQSPRVYPEATQKLVRDALRPLLREWNHLAQSLGMSMSQPARAGGIRRQAVTGGGAAATPDESDIEL